MDVLTQLAPAVFPVVDDDEGVVGTAFFFSRHGWALTALHVLSKGGRAARLGETLRPLDLDSVHRSELHDAAAVRVDGTRQVEAVQVDTRWHPDAVVSLVAASHQEHRRFAEPVPLHLRCEGEPEVRELGDRRLTLTSLPSAAYRPRDAASGSPVAVNLARLGAPPRVVAMFQGGWRPTRLHDRDGPRINYGLSLGRLAATWPFIANVGYRGPDAACSPELVDHIEPFLPIKGHLGTRMSVNHVTVDNYNEYLADTGLSGPVDGPGDFPVTRVSPVDAEKYALWLGDRLGRRCRLPTYDEWLAAARAGRGEAWLDDDIRRHSVNFRGTRREVWSAGYLGPNPWGFYDLAGNVWDICRHADRYVLAGGWAKSVRAELAGRKRIHERFASPSAGFRCVCEIGGG